MSLLSRLKAIANNISTTDLDDAIEYQMQAEALREAYRRHNVPSPEPLDDVIRQFERLIGDKVRDTNLMNLRRLEDQEAADLDKSERRAKRQAEMDKLRAQLGIKTEEKVPTTV